jgi:hypothetical protein
LSFLFSGFLLKNSSNEILYKSLGFNPKDAITFKERGLL